MTIFNFRSLIEQLPQDSVDYATVRSTLSGIYILKYYIKTLNRAFSGTVYRKIYFYWGSL